MEIDVKQRATRSGPSAGCGRPAKHLALRNRAIVCKNSAGQTVGLLWTRERSCRSLSLHDTLSASRSLVAGRDLQPFVNGACVQEAYARDKQEERARRRRANESFRGV
jgi:hypothetical protein